MQAVSRSVGGHKLGDLLLAAGLVSRDQLGGALALQKATGEPLGKVLVRQGIVSAGQVYRKLAEQWCIKASTAGMVLMMQTFAPSPAHAEGDGISAQFRMASAASVSVYKPFKGGYSSLFGTREVKSDDISAFTKWTTVISRFEEQMKAQSSSPRMQLWKAAIRDLKGKSVKEQIEGVDGYVNEVRYIEDGDNYNKSDYWATPIEFFSRGGDCEDFAIAKYASLRALGFSSDQLRIAIVQDKIKNIPHAILIVYSDEGTFVLDNQDKLTRKTADVSRYRPIFSINATNWWLHKA